MNKVIAFSASEAGIDPQAISANALKVVRDIQHAGFQAYLVGGCVRDLLLGTKPKDFDVATDATPEQVKSAFSNSRIIGRRFKIVHVRFGYDVIEVATFRGDASDREEVGSHEMTEGKQGQLLRDNVYGTIEEDVLRRDFRVNALYYNPVADEVLDFLGGMDDLKHKKLVSIGTPEQRFREDPVRMLRVVRFAAKLKFTMEPEALKMIDDEGKLLSHVSAARLFEEVLKLFHGGAAYETFLLLRKYGLFKYLFPFTDQCVIEGVEGMTERALQNTDKRIAQGKPVIPAFLFACMLWDPVKADAQMLMTDGTPEPQAWRTAMSDGLRDQNQYVAVPRRLAEIILDIWNIHFRLIKANPRMVRTSLNNRRFRAAYDFLLLRTALHEVDQKISDWWTRIQEVDASEKDIMINELGYTYKSQKDTQSVRGEPNGNSVDYRHHGKRGGSRPQSRMAGSRSNYGHNRQGGLHRGNYSATMSNSGNGGRRNSYASKNGGKGSNGGYHGRGANQGYNQGTNSGYINAQPKDKLGNFQTSSGNDIELKKVKVRRKRRVAERQPDSDTDNKPHF